MRRVKKVFSVLFIAMLPLLADACSMCGGAVTPEKKSAYVGTTVFLAIMPLLVTGLIFAFILKKYRGRG